MHNFSKKINLFLYFLLVSPFLYATNAHSGPSFALQKDTYSALNGWYTSHQKYAIVPMQKSCKKILKAKNSYKWNKICKEILYISPYTSSAKFREFLQNHFTPYLVTTYGKADGIFTGYYIPLIKGSLTPSTNFRVPIYGKPYNLVRLKYHGKTLYRLKINGKYYRPPSRATISNGPALKNAPILAWVHSKVDRFFLQIQGSGKILLPNGRELLLGYAAQNGYPYYAIGKYFVANNIISKDKISMQSIKKWLDAHPADVVRILNKDPSFVFMRKMPTNQPVGAAGVTLTPQRSLAIDRRYIKYNTPIWLETYYPAHGTYYKFNKLMMAQDTGGAIRGPIRGDVYWGDGSMPELIAGHMKSTGRYWELLPK